MCVCVYDHCFSMSVYYCQSIIVIFHLRFRFTLLEATTTSSCQSRQILVRISCETQKTCQQSKVSSQNYLTSTINAIKRLRSRKTHNYKNNRRMKHVLHEFSIVITDTLGLYNVGKVILLGREGCVVSYCCIVGKTTDMLDIWTDRQLRPFNYQTVSQL